MNTTHIPPPPEPALLVIEDDETLNRLLAQELRKAGYDVRSVHTWAQARSCLKTFSPDLVLLDMQLPDSNGLEPLRELVASYPVVMLTAYGNVNQAVQAMRLGASDYLVKPVDLDELELVIQRALEKSELQKQKECLTGPKAAKQAMAMLGTSQAMQRLRTLIAEVANSEVAVLIQGESGTGKELVAQAIHVHSHRRAEAFVPAGQSHLNQ